MSAESSNGSNFLAQTSKHPYGIHVSLAEGCYIIDQAGNRYLDLIAGISVANVGHKHPRVVEAIKAQSEKYLHTMVYGEYHQDPQEKLAAELDLILPEKLNCSYFVNSGTEANEAALKLAKRHTGRTKIISFKKSYHGSTHGSLSVSGNEEKKFAFRPLLPDVHFLNFNDSHELNKIDNNTAAVIIETVQGDAGVRIPETGFIKKLRAKCDETGTLLIFDEIQVGMGRTGKMFAFEHYNVVPDILTLAKGFGGGMPIGAMVSDRNIMDDLTHNPMLGHITTFGGNPVCCASASATLNVLKEEIDFEEVEWKGELLKKSLIHKEINEIRQIGLMLAIDLENEEKLSRLIEECKKEFVIIYRFLSHPYSFRISPPLNITEEQIKHGCEVILKCLERI